MAQLVWRTDSCLPRFTGRSEVKAVHLLELKNAAGVDFNAIAAKMEETSDRALAEMTALGGQVNRRAANTNFRPFRSVRPFVRSSVLCLNDRFVHGRSECPVRPARNIAPIDCMTLFENADIEKYQRNVRTGADRPRSNWTNIGRRSAVGFRHVSDPTDNNVFHFCDARNEYCGWLSWSWVSRFAEPTAPTAILFPACMEEAS
uniref:Uncharacterized protein n=1 Tax=Caenorhabditis japonica TaxID=281687 RepID=A0A8R1IK82_CAEJA